MLDIPLAFAQFYLMMLSSNKVAVASFENVFPIHNFSNSAFLARQIWKTEKMWFLAWSVKHISGLQGVCVYMVDRKNKSKGHYAGTRPQYASKIK